MYTLLAFCRQMGRVPFTFPNVLHSPSYPRQPCMVAGSSVWSPSGFPGRYQADSVLAFARRNSPCMPMVPPYFFGPEHGPSIALCLRGAAIRRRREGGHCEVHGAFGISLVSSKP